MKKRVILSAGGTGGHLFPAQSLAEELCECEILFVAGGLETNSYFNRGCYSFEEVSCATFSFSKPMQFLQSCIAIYKGVQRSRKIVRRFAPHLVVGFGSFFTLPLLIAALLEKVPIVLHEQNAIPGKVNRLFSLFAHTITITFPMTRGLLKGKAGKGAIEVLFPIRKKSAIKREESWEYFGLSPSIPTLLVFGGSQGAAHLNALFLDALEHLTCLSLQVLHFTGTQARAEEAKKRYASKKIDAVVKSFEPHMDRAMQIADFAISRAGAA